MAFFNTDIPELIDSDTAVCLSNFDILVGRRDRITESMLAMLSELSDAIVRDAGGDPDTVSTILLSLQGVAAETNYGEVSDFNGKHARNDVAAVNRAWLARLSVHTGVHMRLILYRLIAERMGETTAKPQPDAVTDSARGRIAYMSGALSDKAYLRLATLVPRARAAAFHSFVDACEEVRGGLCEYGILPLENTQNGKLITFSRLIIRYGLCVVAVCDVEERAASGHTTRFALVRKAPEDGQIRPMEPGELSPGELSPGERPLSPLYVELLHTVSDPSFSELLTAASFCGLTLRRADTLPRLDESDRLPHESGTVPLPICCVLDATGADMATFRRYLELELSEDILMGLYRAVPNH